MNQLDVAISEYNKTIFDLSARLANAVMQLAVVQAELTAVKEAAEAAKTAAKPSPE